jgi:hypothetical protein
VKTLHLKSTLPGGDEEPVVGAVWAALAKVTSANRMIANARIFVCSLGDVDGGA